MNSLAEENIQLLEAEISTLRSRCETLERERDELLLALDRCPAGPIELRAQLSYDRHRADAAEAARDEAVRALEPFARENDIDPSLPDDTRLGVVLDGMFVAHATAGDFRRARATQPSGKEKG